MSIKKIKSDHYKTILVIVIGMLILYLAMKWKGFITIGVVVGVLGLISEYLAKKIDFLWMKLAWVLSFIVPNILLSAIFYIFLTPVALLSRVFSKKDQLMLKNKSNSTFKTYNKTFDKGSFERPW